MCQLTSKRHSSCGICVKLKSLWKIHVNRFHTVSKLKRTLNARKSKSKAKRAHKGINGSLHTNDSNNTRKLEEITQPCSNDQEWLSPNTDDVILNTSHQLGRTIKLERTETDCEFDVTTFEENTEENAVQSDAIFTGNALGDDSFQTGYTTYVCEICSEAFESAEYLIQHLVTHVRVPKETAANPLMCKFCFRIFKSQYTLNSHLRFHKNSKKSSKPIKKEKKRKEDELLNQSFREESPDNTSSFQRVGVSPKIDTSKPYICLYCSKGFSYKSALLNHIKRLHEKKEDLEKERNVQRCPYCFKGFLYKNALANHIRRLHDDGQDPVLVVKDEQEPIYATKGLQDPETFTGDEQDQQPTKKRSQDPEPVTEDEQDTKPLTEDEHDQESVKRSVEDLKPDKKRVPSKKSRELRVKIPKLRDGTEYDSDSDWFEGYENKKERKLKKAAPIRINIKKQKVKSKGREKPKLKKIKRGRYDCNLCDDVCGKGFMNATELRKHKKTHPFTEGDLLNAYSRPEKNKKPFKERYNFMLQREYPHVCFHCERVFKTEQELEEHQTSEEDMKYACKHCHKVFISGNCLNQHAVCHDLERPFVCEICGKTFRLVSSLTEHQHGHMPKTIPCLECGQSFSLRRFIWKHMQMAHPEKVYSCLYCEETFARKQALTNHQKSHDEPHVCDICEKVMDENTDVWTHIQKHTDDMTKPVLCGLDDCEKKFPNEKYRRIHWRLHFAARQSKKLYKCDVCDEIFSAKKNHAQHMLSHGIDRSYICEVCEKAFKSQGELHVHKVVHNCVEVLCDVCGEKFASKKRLNAHRGTVHGERVFKCDECPAAFKGSGALYFHKRRHAGVNRFWCEYCGRGFIEKTNFSKHIAVHKNERKHKCHMCNKRFNTRQVLRNHFKSHASTLNYTCEKCGAKFKTSTVLRRHLRRHNDERNFACGICSKTFFSYMEATKHSIVHSDVRPYSCRLCSNAYFKRHDHLTTHMRGFHKNKTFQWSTEIQKDPSERIVNIAEPDSRSGKPFITRIDGTPVEESVVAGSSLAEWTKRKATFSSTLNQAPNNTYNNTESAQQGPSSPVIVSSTEASALTLQLPLLGAAENSYPMTLPLLYTQRIYETGQHHYYN